jgi:predicted GIY-YIG superfamily endonuclease
MSYYTKNGTTIYNPTVYAKTGAPMYKTRYGSKNINKATDIYCLDLEKSKKYIGKTTNINKRWQQHVDGVGAKVTKKFTPIKGTVIDTCPGYFADKMEQEYTDKNIEKYGYANVRGGKYVNSKTLTDNSSKYNNYPVNKSIKQQIDADFQMANALAYDEFDNLSDY